MASAAAAVAAPSVSVSPPLKYPETRRSDASHSYFGHVVADPYSWLEDPDAESTQAWVSAQNAVTRSFIDTCSARAPLEARLKEVYNFERVSCPFRKGDSRVFFFRNSGLQNQSVLYKKRHASDEAEEVLLDPNTLAEDGTAALGACAVSPDASMLAYGVSRSGSDWTTVSVMQVDDNSVLSDRVDWVKFSGLSWTHDSKGFFYSRYPQPAAFQATAEQEADPDFKRGTETESVTNHMVYYHRVGTNQSEDVLVHSTPSTPQWTLGAEVSEDGAYLLLTMSESCDTKNRLYIAPLNADKSFSPAVCAGIVPLIDRFEAEFEYVNNEGSLFWFKTNHQAGRYKVITIDIAKENAGTDTASWVTVIPEHAKDVLESVSIVNQRQLITVYSHDVKQIISLFDLEGNLLRDEFALPDVGSISGLSARKEDSNFFFSFSSFLYPGVIFSVDLAKPASEQLTVFRETVLPGFDASLFTTRQVFYPSKDGTMIPMFIVHRKDLVLDGSNPTWQYGYGGFNISLPPAFSVARVVFMQHFNGVFACPNIRGGGEYGEAWYKAGVLHQKQNVFDDFIAAAEYLVKEKYTSPAKLAINGGSNGGLLVAACLNQRPDLFGAVIGQVGVLDMLRFHKWTIGYAWASDYGTSEQDVDMFHTLHRYSPVHNVRKDAAYPALLLCTSDHDDRVVPLHSYKYISEVQSVVSAHPEQAAPLLIRVEEKAGHGAGLPLAKRIAEQADTLSFMSLALNAKVTF
jgi:prolyl oligopeptidase